jgi:hypothetical protein
MTHRLAAALAALCAGCFAGHGLSGGEDTGTAAEDDAAPAVPADAGPWFGIDAGDGPASPATTSLNVTVRSVSPDGAGPLPPFAESPAIGAHARLDLPVSDGGAGSAVLTTRWGEPAYMNWSPGDIVQRISPPIGGVGSLAWNGHTVDGWEVRTLVDHLAVDGTYDGGALDAWGGGTFRGTELWQRGDESGSRAIRGEISVAPDDLPPEARFVAPETLPVLLPWTAVRLTLAEPIQAGDLVEHLRASAPIALPAWRFETTVAESSDLRPDGWWPPDATVRIELAGGYTDPAGNAGAAAGITLPRVAEPTPVTSLDFESAGGSSVTTWGRTAAVPDGIDCAAGEGCLAMAHRRGEATGVYLRIAGVPAFDGIAFRIRVLVAADLDVEYVQTMVHKSGAAPGTTSSGVGTNVFADRTGGGPFAYDSGWEPQEVIVYPRPVDEAAFALAFEAGTALPGDAAYETLVLIDDVRPADASF